MSSGQTKPALERAREILRDAIPNAALALVACLEAKDLGLRLKAAAAILNRAGLSEAKAINTLYAHRSIGGED